MGSRLVVVVLMFGFLMQVHAEDRRIVVSVKDADSGVGIASRIYLSSSDGMPLVGLNDNAPVWQANLRQKVGCLYRVSRFL
ncbi:MAG: hypothetical protein OSA98_18595 [Rubripirellula sp.]|nr:hypothetical protein [Rubripirellula sp.]